MTVSILYGVAFQPFTLELLWLGLGLVALLTCSALISGSEAAFFSLSPTDIRTLEESETKPSRAAVRLLEDKNRLLSTLLIANNLVNIGAILLANAWIDQMVHFGGGAALEFVVKVVVVTFVLLLFGEIMPKIFAAYNTLAFVRRMALAVWALQRFFRPLSTVLIKAGGAITGALARKQSNLSMSELTDAIQMAQTDSADDKKMLTGIVRFVRTEVDQIMKPRIDVAAIEIGQGFEQVKKTVVQSGFSRIPAYDENLDTIRGILYVKDLLPYLVEDDGFEWQRLLRPAYFVPEHKKINDLLEDFQKKKIHIAVVVDEYGGTLGIVSLEDILEEIVGEIADESDVEAALYEQIDPDTYLFPGSIHLGDFLKIMALPDTFLERVRGDADTVAGLLLEIKGDFLEAGESVCFDGLEFTALAVENRRITKVRAVRFSAEDGGHSEDNIREELPNKDKECPKGKGSQKE